MLESCLNTNSCEFVIDNVQSKNKVTDEYALKCSTPSNTQSIVVLTQCYFEPKVGMSIRVSGDWLEHPQYGRCFAAKAAWPSDCRINLTGKVIVTFLKSGVIKGIGTSVVKALEHNVGDDFLDILKNDPVSLSKIPNFGPKKIETLSQYFENDDIERDTLVFLLGHGINKKLTEEIMQTYGGAASLVMQTNPYRLALDIEGIRFTAVDDLAKLFGVDRSAATRIDALVLHKLKALEQETGSSDTLRKELEKSVARILRLSIKAVTERVEHLIELGKVLVTDTSIALNHNDAFEALDVNSTAEVIVEEAIPTPVVQKDSKPRSTETTDGDWEALMNDRFADLKSRIKVFIDERSQTDEKEIAEIAHEKAEELAQKFEFQLKSAEQTK